MTAFLVGSGSYQQAIPVNLTPSAITANNVSVETFAPAGLAPLTTTSNVYVSAPSLEAGLAIIQSKITATGTLQLTIWNFSGSTVTPALQQFNVLVF